MADDERRVISGESPRRSLTAEQQAALERILSRSYHLGGRAPARDELQKVYLPLAPTEGTAEPLSVDEPTPVGTAPARNQRAKAVALSLGKTRPA